MEQITKEYIHEKFHEINLKLDKLIGKNEFIIEDDEVSYIYQAIPYYIKQQDDYIEIEMTQIVKEYIENHYNISMEKLIIFYADTIGLMVDNVIIDDDKSLSNAIENIKSEYF